MREDYDPAADGIRSYYAALEAKRARGDTHYVKPPVDYEIDAEPPIEVPGPMSWECKCFLIAVGIVIAMLVLWAGRADAHQAMSGQQYSAFCCQGNRITGDCEPIPERTVAVIPGGFRITLRPGDHHLVTKLHVFEIEQSKAQKSSDGQYHACLYPNEDILRCFYAPPLGM